MDTSETRIKMCACEEIQRQWTLHDNDTYYYVENRFGVEYPRIDKWCEQCAEENGLSLPTNAIWLPHQDQLQEMVIPEPFRDWRNALSFFDDFIDWDNLSDYGSMEQLCQAFVMKEKYNKIWDGEAWYDIRKV